MHKFDYPKIKAADKLGYRGMVRASLSENRVADIRAFLREKDIRPFTMKSVNRYKKRKIREAEEWLTRAGLCAFGIGLVVLTCWLGWFANHTTVQWLSIACGLFAIVTAICGILFIVASFPIQTTRFEWETTRLSGYEEPVPEFALQTALDVCEKFADVSILIDELLPKIVERVRPATGWHDPFLVLQLPDQTLLYVEVWNEPKYKQDREA